jgi:uncharacterized membrane protein HdeD (DUF308 family)
MKMYSQYWTATLVRGLVAILAATGILFLPELSSLLLLRPVGVIAAILCLAAYGILDSAVVFATSFMVRAGRPGRLPLALQGVTGIVIGVLLFALVYDRIDLGWFVYMAAFQAASTACIEFYLAQRTARQHGAMWCYAATAIAAMSAVGLLLGRNGDAAELCWLLFAYLGIFGFNLFSLAARMLFAERELSHPVSA